MENQDLNDTLIPYVLRKDNYQPNLITNTRRDFTLNQARLFCIIVNQFNHNQFYMPNQNIKFRIPIYDVSKFIDYKELKDACNSFQDKFIYQKNTANIFQKMIAFPNLIHNKDEGVIEVTVFADVIPHFISLGKEYTRYNLEIMLSLTSKHSQRIFEILRLHQGRKQYKFIYDFNDLKDILSCENYTFYDFKKYVLQPSQKELFDKAGISFDFNTGTKKRGIDKINFEIISWKEYAHNEVSQEIADYSVAPTANQFHGVQMILQTQYTFKAMQIKKIVDDESLRLQFIELHSKIEQGLIKIKTTPTRYVAKVLGFSKI